MSSSPSSPNSSAAIRQAFLDYFARKGHERLASGPLVPANDPTLMFSNAGMVQFKDVFTGKDKRSYTRATTSQKCIRISGKHNDLENVGVTARHHTFFEMLGNFSFGDYFKKDAVHFAWEFLTKEMQLDPERLVISVFGGENGVPADEEAAALWKDVSGFGPERIFRLGAKDNFWQMGDTGPCGPCSEIHCYIGDGKPDPKKFGDEPGVDGKGWTEIWNLVFMQFNRHADGKLDPLPAPSIDTGMGLERLSVLKQGVSSNYDTDLLRPIVDLAAEISGKKYGGTLAKDDVSMRVIADHARTAAFLIAEGIFPDRDGRAYVLRRVMRRAIRHGHRLGIESAFLHECALKVVDNMGEAYPQLVEQRALIEEVTHKEEDRFRRTLRRGLDLLAENDAWETDAGGAKVLPGRVAFALYDTYGFPLDLQDVIGEEGGFRVDHAGFEKEMDAARERSSGSKVGEAAVGEIYRAVEAQAGKTTFIGYKAERGEGVVKALVRGGASVTALAAGEEGEVVVDTTPFYGESGGQMGDQGEIRSASSLFRVADTQKPFDGLWVHRGKLEKGALKVGDKVELEVDHARRAATRRNHSATHLLHWALRTVLGPQSTQKGSLVGPDRLRFDYTGSRPLTDEEIARIEDLVNGAVLENAAITTDELPMDEAKSRGAIGIFEEKYGAEVRMLTIGPSIELCGGTHASRTGDIGFLKVLSESGLAAGVRRIEAATGHNALRHVRALETDVQRVGELVKAQAGKVVEKVEKLIADQRALEKELEDTKRKLVSGGTGDLTAGAKDMGGVRVLGAAVDLDDSKALRELADSLRDKLAPSVILLGSKTKDGKVLLVCSVSKEVTGRAQAGAIIRDAAAIVGGGGGGRPDFAQAGGSDPSKLDEAVQRVYALVQ
jgi:alanyl-tRNA synthetase